MPKRVVRSGNQRAPDVTPLHPAWDAPAGGWKARWIWYPEGASLTNTFVLFRRDLPLRQAPASVKVAVSAETRYTLYVNGREICSGPPPYDPRWPYFDEVEIASFLRPGRNVIGARAWFFGQHDGVSVAGAPPGFCLQGTIRHADGRTATFHTEAETWTCHLLQAYRTGTRRWFLRSLNEELDARRLPRRWMEAGFKDPRFVKPVVSEVPPGRPMYFMKSFGDLGYPCYPKRNVDWRLVRRDIPFMEETPESPGRLIGCGTVRFQVEPEDYFSRGLHHQVLVSPCRRSAIPFTWPQPLRPRGPEAAYLLVDFGQLRVGRIRLDLCAPAGTVIEVAFDERRRDGKLLTPSPRLRSWARYTCREGRQMWTTVDFESFRYLQVMARHTSRPVTIHRLEVLHRRYPVNPRGRFTCSDPQINRLWEVAAHTVEHCCHEQIVDNNHRERQQYSGDIEWAKLALYYLWGDYALARKGLVQFGQGQMPNGQFMTCWPTGGRVEALAEYRMGVDLTAFELVDHSLNYLLGIWRHFLFTGDRSILEELYPCMLRFWEHLRSRLDRWGMIDHEVYGEGVLFIDHTGWGNYRDNMASAAMLHSWTLTTLARVALELGQPGDAARAAAEARRLRRNIRRRFYRPDLGTFVNNPDEVREGKPSRQHENTLALAILLDLAPKAAQRELFGRIENPKSGIGHGTPVSTNFMYWAAAKLGRVDYVLRQFRQQWLGMPAVQECRTIGENWKWHPFQEASCQNLPVPAYLLPDAVLGIRPLSPGFKTFSVDPQLGGLARAAGTVPTPHGDIVVRLERRKNGVSVELQKPKALEPVIARRLRPKDLSGPLGGHIELRARHP